MGSPGAQRLDRNSTVLHQWLQSHTNVHLVVFNVAYKWTDDGSLLMALNSGHISNHKRTSRDIYNKNGLQIGYRRTIILLMKPEPGTVFQCTEFLEFLDTRLSSSLKTWSTGMPLYHIYIANINFVHSGYLYANDLQIWVREEAHGKIFYFTVFWRSRTCSIVDHRICDCKHHAEAPDDTSWRCRCKAGLLLMERHIKTIIYSNP